MVLPHSGKERRAGNNGPGPGSYFASCLSKAISRVPTLKGRAKSSRSVLSHVDFVASPGPCAYNVPPSINSVGKYADSRFTNSLAKSFDPPSYKNLGRTFTLTEGFAIPANKVPGPGAYKIANGISGSGEYFLSKIPSTKGFGFAKGVRNLSNCSSYSRLKTPGPGCYRTLSEFGYMESANEGFLKTAGGFNKRKLVRTASKSVSKLHVPNDN